MIEQALRQVSYPTQPVGLYEPIAYVLDGGGKRIRPMLTLMGYSLYRDDVERALPAALALETYHNHTLLHDDLMDHAEVRRARPVVHKKWDENTAILSGDTMLIMAFRHLLAVDMPQPQALWDLFSRSAQEICEGQQYDVNFESRTDVEEEEYIEMIRLKTSVLLACSLKAGALVADAPAADADALYRFAERVGLAFQLQDDYLDVYGDPKVFGKKIGGDILWADHTMADEAKIQAVRNLYDDLHIADDCTEAINAYYAEARKALDSVALPQAQKAPLWEYAASLLGRTK